MFTYEINGKTYTQKKLVLGQVAALSALLGGVRLYAADAMGLIAGLGELLPHALAIVLIPEGQHPADKDMAAMQRELYDTDLEMAIKVVEDFFDCNPLPSLLERVTGLTAKVTSGTGLAS